MKQNKGIGVVGIIVIAVFALALVGVGYFVGNNGKMPEEQTQVQETVTPTPYIPGSTSPAFSPSPTPAPSTIVATTVAGQMKYTNPSAGMSFLFAKTANGETYDVKEVGDMIYVYDTKYPYTQGQYVKVFPKNPADTLDQAIQKKFLSAIDPKDCYVAPGNTDTGAKFPPTYTVRTLQYPSDPNSDIPAFAQDNKCPAGYAATNGISYFLGDTAHPKVFLFFSIGQYGIGSGSDPDTTWQDTIKFLN